MSNIKLKVQTPQIALSAKTGIDVIQYGTLTVGETTTLAAGENATISNSGTVENAVLNFGIPKGHDGTNIGIATTNEAIAGVVDTKAMTPLKTKEAIEQGTNVFTALNTFRANIKVSNGTAAGSGGRIDFGISPAAETVQARISADALGGLLYHTSTNQPHVFRIGTNNDVLSIRDDTLKMSLISYNNAFATVTHAGVAKWLGNAKTATKLETSRTINGVAFDGTKDITIYNTEGHLVFPNGAEFWIG